MFLWNHWSINSFSFPISFSSLNIRTQYDHFVTGFCFRSDITFLWNHLESYKFFTPIHLEKLQQRSQQNCFQTNRRMSPYVPINVSKQARVSLYMSTHHVLLFNSLRSNIILMDFAYLLLILIVCRRALGIYTRSSVIRTLISFFFAQMSYM